MPAAKRAPPVKGRFPVRERDLLSRPGPELAAVLEKVPAALAKAVPIPPGHRGELPAAVRELSRLLTSERGERSRSYWSAPRLAAAYLYFFLPWNIFRLAWLLPGLDLPLGPGGRILDLGSGPLTLPLALWCARPDLRRTPLFFDCTDVAVKPMEYGRAVFYALAGEDSPWLVSLRRAPVEKALRPERGGRETSCLRPAGSRRHGYDCIMAGNVVNELCADTARDSLSTLAGRLADLTGMAFDALAPEGRLFLLEPGTRFGGRLIALARKGALDRGFVPLAPCTHAGPCPMLKNTGPALSGRSYSDQNYSGWCHFIHPAEHAPAALRELGVQARLRKNSLALSCLLLRRPESGPASAPAAGAALDDLERLYEEIMREESAARPDCRERSDREAPGKPAQAVCSESARVRVISSPLGLPGEEAPARYACCEKGLALLLNAGRLPSGALVTLPWSERERRDPKTGALLLTRPPHGTDTQPPGGAEKQRSGGENRGRPQRRAGTAGPEKSGRAAMTGTRSERGSGHPDRPAGAEAEKRGTKPARRKGPRSGARREPGRKLARHSSCPPEQKLRRAPPQNTIKKSTDP